MRTTRTLALAALVALGACEAQEPAEEGATVDTTAAAAAEDAEAAIRANNDRFEQAVLASDSVAIAGLYTEDAVVLPPNMPKSVGRAEIQSTFGGMMAATPITSIELETEEVTTAGSGDLAYEVGRYQIAGTAPDGTTWRDSGKYLVVWRNVGGEWMLAADAWSSDSEPITLEGTSPAPADTETPETM